MNYHEITIDGNDYKCKLATKDVVNLEKRLGRNPVAIFQSGEESRIPTITELMYVFHASLQQYNHGISLDDAYDLYDKYIADGHSQTDFVPEVLDIYRVSGLLASEDEQSKN